MTIEEHQWKPIVEGTATFAITFAEMGESEEEAREKLIGYLRIQLHLEQPEAVQVLRAAAGAIANFPQPIDEAPDKLERARRIRKMLGAREAEDDLVAMLTAREWLERLADDLERGLMMG